MSKARSDSVLDGLPRNQREALEEWLFEENLSYQDAKKRLWQDFNVSTSRSGLERFYARVNQRRLLQRIAENAGKAREIEGEFAKHAAPVPEAVVKLVTQLAFEEMTAGRKLDKDFIVKLTKLAVDSGLKAKKLELDERKIELLEAKAKQADEATQALKNPKLSEEEQKAKLKEIFGIPT
jgi:hypothetical protein